MTNAIEPWKLTAYALGELDADETQQVRIALETDPALRLRLQEMQNVIDRVQSSMQRSPALEEGLTESQTATIAEHFRQANTEPIDQTSNVVAASNIDLQRETLPVRNTRSIMWGLLALAASVLVAAIWLPARLNKQKLAHDFRTLRTQIHTETSSPTSSIWIDPNLPLVASSGSDLVQSQPAVTSPTPAIPKGANGQQGQYLLYDDVQFRPSTSVGALSIQPQSNALKEQSENAIAQSPSLDISFPKSNFSASAPPIAPANVSDPFGPDSTKPNEIAASDAMPSTTFSDRTIRDRIGMQSVDLSLAIEAKEEPAKSINENAIGEQLADSKIVLSKNNMGGGMGGGTSSTTDSGSVGLVARNPEATRPSLIAAELYSTGKGLNAPEQTGDRYEPIIETPFASAEQAPLSTFSIDVDTASYSKIRQYLMQANQLPRPDAVRIEELVNYFEYDYAGPTDEHPFASNMAVHTCPWNEDHKLVRIGMQAKKIDVKERTKANLVFLLDVSGSMDEPNKLPLVKQAISMLVRQLGENDRIAIVVYAGAAGCVLPSITGDRQAPILAALEELNAGGSTNGGQGIELAYSIAREHFIPGGINRVILCTDGDFNVGTTSNEALVKLVHEQAKSKVFLTCLGFGIGNYNDSMMEMITNQGNGIYGMVDNAREARRLMIEQLSGTLITVAKDVKIQVEFNPEKIARYRLIGYENRRLANQDFNDDKKDAGEIGAGHRVTALYEIVPVGVAAREPQVDELRYRAKKKASENSETDDSGDVGQSLPARSPSPPAPLPEDGERGARDRREDGTKKINTKQADKVSGTGFSNEWLTLKLRYKQPEGDVSSKIEFFLTDEMAKNADDDSDFRWSSAVAEFGLLLRRSQLAPQADWRHMIERARSATGDDPYRIECLEMMNKAKSLSGR